MNCVDKSIRVDVGSSFYNTLCLLIMKMADLQQCSWEFLAKFIMFYESFPCVWRIKSKEYSDRNKKRQAYESCFEKCNEIDATTTKVVIIC